MMRKATLGLLMLLAVGCAPTTGLRLAGVASPNQVLTAAARKCAEMPDEEVRQVCITGVLAELERATKTAEAAAKAAELGGGGFSPYYPYYGMGGYTIPYPYYRGGGGYYPHHGHGHGRHHHRHGGGYNPYNSPR